MATTNSKTGNPDRITTEAEYIRRKAIVDDVENRKKKLGSPYSFSVKVYGIHSKTFRRYREDVKVWERQKAKEDSRSTGNPLAESSTPEGGDNASVNTSLPVSSSTSSPKSEAQSA